MVTVPEMRIIGITGLPEIQPGDDLPGQLVDAARNQGTPIESGDILVVTQKIVSKAEGRLVPLAGVEPSAFAVSIAERYDKDPRLVELVLRESTRIVRMDQGVIITETLHGYVCANVDVAVIVSDTFGRPWREGCTNVAIGVAGMEPLADYRGQRDPAGMELKVSVLATADELASATELVMGKLDRVPAAVVRGYAYTPGETGVGPLLRSPERDLFR